MLFLPFSPEQAGGSVALPLGHAEAVRTFRGARVG